MTLSFSAYLAGRTVARDRSAGRSAWGAGGFAACDMPWNARECTIEDPDGYRLTFTEPINIDRNFDDVIEEAKKAEVG